MENDIKLRAVSLARKVGWPC